LACTCFHTGILLSLFDPKDGADMFLQNIGWLSTDYTMLHPRRQHSSQPPLWEPQILLVHSVTYCQQHEDKHWQMSFQRRSWQHRCTNPHLHASHFWALEFLECQYVFWPINKK
jgi:hypothetical protein